MFIRFAFVLIVFCAAPTHAENDVFVPFPANMEIMQKFEISNSTDNILKLGKIRTSCTCIEAKCMKHKLQPGEATVLNVTLKANSQSGPFSHAVYVETDNPRQRFMKFVIKGNAIPLLNVSPAPKRYIGALQAGARHEYRYEIVPTSPHDKIDLELVRAALPRGTDICLEKKADKFLLMVSIVPQGSQKAVSVSFAVKIKEPKGWGDIQFALNGRIQDSLSMQQEKETKSP